MKDIILILIVVALFVLIMFGAELFRLFGALFRRSASRKPDPPEEIVFNTSESSAEEIAAAVGRLKEKYGSEAVTVRVDGVSVPFDNTGGSDVEHRP